jgi:hypothetical protein
MHTHLQVCQPSSVLLLEDFRQQKGQQVLELLKVVLQWRARQHDAPPAQAGHPGAQQSAALPLQPGSRAHETRTLNPKPRSRAHETRTSAATRTQRADA